MAEQIQHMNADKKFVLGDGGGGVTFRGSVRHVLVEGDIAKLAVVFAAQTNLSWVTFS